MIQIRLANEYDSQHIVDFQIEMAMETEGLELSHKIVSEGVKSVFQDPSKGKYYVATNDENILASLLLTPEWSDWRNAWVMWIQSVYVMPEKRNKGVFKLMYKYILESVKENEEIAGLRLYVDLSNNRARAVYKQLGMNGDHYQLFEHMK